MRRVFRKLVVFFVLLACIAGLGRAWYYYEFPYGYNHCCDLQLRGSLESYAARHNGWFPKGASCPEASLSLMYASDPQGTDAHLLAGKTIPTEAAQELLSRGELLTPETCDWHYVEGLRSDDDRHIAIFWDKIGLGHDGQRKPSGGHTVMFIGYDREWISAEDWDQFVSEQKKLVSALPKDRGAPVKHGQKPPTVLKVVKLLLD